MSIPPACPGCAVLLGWAEPGSRRSGCLIGVGFKALNWRSGAVNRLEREGAHFQGRRGGKVWSADGKMARLSGADRRHLMMDVTFHPGPAPLLAAAGAYLAQERFSASVLAVVARRVADGEEIGGPDALWATVRDGNEVVGAAMRTPPWNLFLARMAPPAAVALADAIAGASRALPGVTGEAATVSAFAARWKERTGSGSQVRLRQRLYVLAELAAPTDVPGGDTLDDLGLLAR